MLAIRTDYIDSNENKKIFELPWMQWNEPLRLVVERDEKLVVWTSSAGRALRWRLLRENSRSSRDSIIKQCRVKSGKYAPVNGWSTENNFTRLPIFFNSQLCYSPIDIHCHK